MVTVRTPLDYHGLGFTIAPVEGKPFFSTGESPQFKMTVLNSGEVRRHGRIFYTWRLGTFQTFRFVDIELKPRERKEYELVREWLAVEGTGVYAIKHLQSTPEESQSGDVSFINRSFQWPGEDPMCTFSVRDKDIIKWQDRRWWLTTILAVAALLVAIFR